MLVSVFEKVLSMSFIGTYAIGIVFLVRLLLRKCERKYAFFLWFVVFFNLCLPISIQAPISLVPRRVVEVAQLQDSKEGEVAEDDTGKNTNFIESDLVNGIPLPDDRTLTELQQQADFVPGENILQVPLPNEVTDTVVAENEPVVIPEEMQDTGREDTMNWQSVLAGMWLLGIGIVWGISGVQILRLNRKLKKATQAESGQGDIVCIEGIASPFLWGIIKPTIYLPMNLEEMEKEYIIAHESYHKKRKDYIIKLLVFAIVSIHWFNPLVWIAYALFCKDMEISCDEAVLSHSKEKINKQYAASLLKYAAKQNGFVLTPLTFGEPSVKSRIRNVLRYKKGSIVVTVLAVCVVSLTACGLMVRTEDEEPAEGAVNQSGFEKEQNSKEQNGKQENDKDSTSIGESLPEPDSTLAPDVENTVDEANERGEIVLVQDGDYRQIKVLWEDLDGNGQQEYFILDSEVNSSKLRLYFNEKLVYTQESPELSIMSVDQKEYLDLDNDGEKEIFVSYSPRVNSRPLEEWFVLKQTDSGWEALQQYHNENSSSGIDNSFPITVTLYKKPYELMIACEGFDKKIYYNAAKHYEEIKEDMLVSSIYSIWLGNSDNKEGDIVGGTEAWGVWDIEVGEYEGENCLIAEHGIIGISSVWDHYGTVYVYFNYNDEGQIRILDLVFKEYGEDKTIAATTSPTSSPAQEVTITSKAPLEHSTVKEVTQYTGAVPAYHTNRQSFSKSDGSVKCKIDWMKLSDELVLEDLSFDLTMEFIEKKVLTGAILDIFYDEDEHGGTVSLLVNGYKSNESEGYREATWLIQFSPIKPEGYTMVAYDTQAAWFGEVKYVGGCFYLHGGAGSLPYEIDPHALPRKGRSCEKEYWRAMGVANGFIDTLRDAQGIDTTISWFTVIGERNDCTIYQGLIQEEMDAPVLAKVYVASKDGLIVDAWLVEQEKTITEPEQENTSEAAYYFKTGDFGDYNASFTLNGFEYRFLLDMDVENMKLEVGDSTEEERYGYKITVSPAYVTDGKQKEYLGDIHGYRFYMNAEHYVGPKYADATKLCGRIMSVDEQGMSVYLGKEVDRDTYTEFMNNSTKETYYAFAEDVEYIMLEAEFRSVPVTYERFMQIWESKDCNTTFYYFFEKDGKIVQIWEPFTP